jgi:hypothetical protein
MYRREGLIPNLKQNKYPRRVLVLDTEAFRGEVINGVEAQSFRLGVIRYMLLDNDLTIIDNGYERFTSSNGLADYVSSFARKDKVSYVYAHNLKYDLQLSGLLTRLLDQGWKISLFVLDDPPSFIRLKRGRLSLLFVDTFNYWQTSVKQMGLQLGKDKFIMPEEKDTDQSLFEYCRRDVDILAEYLLAFYRFLLQNDLAGLGLTLASQAFRSYRHRFMSHPIYLHNDKEATLLERDSYTGGRVEAFYIGSKSGGDYFKLDVNSMYPYVMKEQLYPYEFVSYAEGLSLQQLSRLMQKYYVIAEVEVKTDRNLYPIRRAHKLIFPIGSFIACLHHGELEQALAHDEIRGAKRVVIYNQADIFSSYVDFFYNLKLQAEDRKDSVARYQAKILLNSLYGKFGQRSVVSKLYDNPQGLSYSRVTGFSESLGYNVEVNYIGSQIEVRYKAGESVYSFPAISGGVTAYARLYLYRLMDQAGLANVFYIDTDSLIVNLEGYHRLKSLIHPSNLGSIKLESQASQFSIFGAKDYIFGEEVKHKGLPKAARPLNDTTWEYEQFRGAKSWISQGLPEGVEIYTRIKERKSLYDKGIITSSGEVLPLRLDRGQG